MLSPWVARERKYTFEFSFFFTKHCYHAGNWQHECLLFKKKRATFGHECVIPGEDWVVCP